MTLKGYENSEAGFHEWLEEIRKDNQVKEEQRKIEQQQMEATQAPITQTGTTPYYDYKDVECDCGYPW